MSAPASSLRFVPSLPAPSLEEGRFHLPSINPADDGSSVHFINQVFLNRLQEELIVLKTELIHLKPLYEMYRSAKRSFLIAQRNLKTLSEKLSLVTNKLESMSKKGSLEELRKSKTILSQLREHILVQEEIKNLSKDGMAANRENALKVAFLYKRYLWKRDFIITIAKKYHLIARRDL
jgi:hypothetical protein